MKCANCTADAFYVYEVTPGFPTYFCSLHLPRFLKDQRHGGAVKKYEAPAPTPTPTKSSKKSTPAPEPEPEVVEEETPTEE